MPNKYRDPGADQRLMKLEQDIMKTKPKGKKKKATKSKKTPCGTGSLSGSTYKG